MAKTFLQLINAVHGFTRRDIDGTGVAAINEDADTTVIANFINHAKERVEGKWKWNTLRTTVTFAGVASTYTYDLSTLGTPNVTERSQLLFDLQDNPLFWDVTSPTSGYRMRKMSRDDAIDVRRQNDTQTTTAPDLFSIYRTGTGLTVLLPIAPTAARSYSMELYQPQAELTNGATTLTCPWRPVVLLATGMTLEERGDDFGVTASRFYDMYEEAIAEEIEFDKDEDDNALEPR